MNHTAPFANALAHTAARIHRHKFLAEEARQETQKLCQQNRFLEEEISSLKHIETTLNLLETNLSADSSISVHTNTEKTYPFVNDVSESQNFPKIQVPILDWVTKALEEIKEVEFSEAEATIKKERETLGGLEISYAKYGEKLRKVEEKLVQGYGELRSKRRFI